jgi:hypothetical protein
LSYAKNLLIIVLKFGYVLYYSNLHQMSSNFRMKINMFHKRAISFELFKNIFICVFDILSFENLE